MTSFGWIGLGRIGTEMCLRLVRAGHDVAVHDADRSRLAPALAAGAKAAASAAAAALAAEAVFLSVTDTDAVEGVALGEGGLAETIAAGALVVDHTSIDPVRTRAIAARLGARRQARWVDAPVSGSPGATLAVFLGGDAADVARVRPWLEAYARRATHVGPLGAGQVAKSCNQAIVCATLAAWSEILAYTERLGLDRATLMRAVEGGGADSSVRRHFETDLLERRLPAETLRNLTKDLEIAQATAASVALDLPLNAAVAAAFRRAFAG